MNPLDYEHDEASWALAQAEVAEHEAMREAVRKAWSAPASETTRAKQAKERKAAELDRVVFHLKMLNFRHTQNWYLTHLNVERDRALWTFKRWLVSIGAVDESKECVEVKKGSAKNVLVRRPSLKLSQLVMLRRSLVMKEKRRRQRESPALRAWLEVHSSETRVERRYESSGKHIPILPTLDFANLTIRGKPVRLA